MNNKNITIDAHVHICPLEIRKNRENFLENEPEFSIIYKDPKAELIGASELIQTMDEQGVDKSVVFGFPWRKPYNYQLNNDYVLEATQRFPDRLISFCCLHPIYSGSWKEVDRCLANGAAGVGELAFYESGIDTQAVQDLKEIVGLCTEAQVPILLHTNEPVGHQYPGKSPMNLAQLYHLLKTYPKVKWILAHFGGGLPFFGFLKKEVLDIISRCWFDTAAQPFLYKPEAISIMAQAVGIEKFLFGSDYPLLPPARYFKEFSKSDLSSSDIQSLLGKNAQNLLMETD